MMTLWMIGLDLRSLVSGLIGIALSDDSAQMVVSFLSLACRVVKGGSTNLKVSFLSKTIIFLYDCKRGDFLLVIAL